MLFKCRYKSAQPAPPPTRVLIRRDHLHHLGAVHAAEEHRAPCAQGGLREGGCSGRAVGAERGSAWGGYKAKRIGAATSPVVCALDGAFKAVAGVDCRSRSLQRLLLAKYSSHEFSSPVLSVHRHADRTCLSHSFSQPSGRRRALPRSLTPASVASPCASRTTPRRALRRPLPDGGQDVLMSLVLVLNPPTPIHLKDAVGTCSTGSPRCPTCEYWGNSVSMACCRVPRSMAALAGTSWWGAGARCRGNTEHQSDNILT